MEANKDTRPTPDPEKYISNFAELAKTAKATNEETEKLFIILRQCYLNPLSFLGPPRNLITDATASAQPLVVSKETWKSRRKKAKSRRKCLRCGETGHDAASCMNQIKCLKCTGQHPTNACKAKVNEENAKMEDKKILPSAGARRRPRKRRFFRGRGKWRK